MKKLMMAVAAVFAVVGMASAATITWGNEIVAKDASGNPMDGGTAYLVYLGENGTLDATFSNGAWSMGDDVVVQSAAITPAPAYSSSTGWFGDAYNTGSKGAGSKYAIIVTDKGASGTTLPTEGYYGISDPYTQTKSDANGTEDFDASNAGFSSVTAATEINGGQTPEPPTPAVPEPTTYALVGLAVAALALRKRLSK